MEIITPQLIYHGTTDQYVASFQQQLLNSQHWRPGRDFGKAFYTTISPAQARKWEHKGARSSLDSKVRACVLEIELVSIPKHFEPLIFLSESLAWAEFILNHRLMAVGDHDPCPQHPDIIIGPMADSDTGKIVAEAVQLKKDISWFYDRITRTAKGRRMDALRLGNQIAFSSEQWESSLRLVGYTIYTGGRWVYHDNSGASQSV